MNAGQLVMSRSTSGNRNTGLVSGGIVGKIGGRLNRLFGCWHSEMSRPFSNDGQSYRVCLSCGARRQFDIRTWETQGDFYYAAQ
jgi:hypothetical protein